MRGCLLLVACLAGTAWADGKVFSTRAAVVDTPDQRALVFWADGRERLVIETAFAGEGDGFAWVVPLPAPPRIEPVSPGVLRTLEVQLAPRLETHAEATYLPALYFLAFFAVVTLLACRARPIALALRLALLVFGLLGGFFLLVATLAPTASVGGGVTVHGRARVGAFHVVTVSAEAAADALAYLDRHGFQVAPGARAAIEAYLREGWVLAVGRLAATEGGGRRAAHPLLFEFASDAPVYPLRLTGIDNGPLALDLYVFGAARAVCDRLETVHCARTAFPEPPGRPFFWTGFLGREIDLHHPGLRRIAEGATVVTKLQGTLSPGEMRTDLQLGWEEFAYARRMLYTPRAARTAAVNQASWLALLALLVAALLGAGLDLVRRARNLPRPDLRQSRRRAAVLWCGALVFGLASGIFGYVTMDVTDAGPAGAPSGPLLHPKLADRIAAVPSLAEARRLAAATWRGQTNPFDGRPVREEDSPGNYVLRERDGRPVYVYYDARGAEFGAGR
ncbi:MAG: DUF2330 domain-containing protein [Planctomycetota bacterium]|jgi:hypothetical protein